MVAAGEAGSVWTEEGVCHPLRDVPGKAHSGVVVAQRHLIAQTGELQQALDGAHGA